MAGNFDGWTTSGMDAAMQAQANKLHPTVATDVKYMPGVNGHIGNAVPVGKTPARRAQSSSAPTFDNGLLTSGVE